MTLLGLPLALWGLLCLGAATVWVVVWPRQAVTPSRTRFFVLRWFHAVVWLLLAAAAFVAEFNVLGGFATARLLAGLALLTYIIFMLTLATARRK